MREGRKEGWEEGKTLVTVMLWTLWVDQYF